jgi:hypothetical protein
MFFEYDHDDRYRLPLRVLGVRAGKDGVRLHDGELTASFGFLNLTVPISNISHAEVTGPYKWFRAIGARLSLADHGLTFGTTTTSGVCLSFIEPIHRVIGVWDHPGLTVTVANPNALVQAIQPSVSSACTRGDP